MAASACTSPLESCRAIASALSNSLLDANRVMARLDDNKKRPTDNRYSGFFGAASAARRNDVSARWLRLVQSSDAISGLALARSVSAHATMPRRNHADASAGLMRTALSSMASTSRESLTAPGVSVLAPGGPWALPSAAMNTSATAHTDDRNEIRIGLN